MYLEVRANSLRMSEKIKQKMLQRGPRFGGFVQIGVRARCARCCRHAQPLTRNRRILCSRATVSYRRRMSTR